MIEPKLQEAILADYDREVGLYQDLSNTAAVLLEQMLRETAVQLHSVTKRYKSRASLAGKLAKPEKEYRQVSDITDLAAVRITTYFAEDVDRVAELVEREFLIDSGNSTDKRKLLDPDRFGYQSLHYIVSVTPERCRLVEYSRFEGRKFEIQVRSILQHAWAEIEHDLGYKSAAGVPREIRRRFSRIAGLLELADDEFATIRRELAAYAATVSTEIQERPANVGIDKISLRALVASEASSVRRLSEAVARVTNAVLTPTTDATLERNVAMLGIINISTIAELEASAATHLPVVEAFARQWVRRKYAELQDSIGLLYLAYVLVSETGDESTISNFVKASRLSDEKENLVGRIRSTYHAAVASAG